MTIKKTVDGENEAYANTLLELAALHEMCGESIMAARYFGECCRIFDSILNRRESHGYTIALQGLVSFICSHPDATKDMLREAQEMMKEVMAIRIKLFGCDHHSVALPYYQLAVVYRRQGNIAKAHEALDEATRINANSVCYTELANKIETERANLAK